MTEENIKTVVLGIGNTLLGDEGIGVHVARKLKNQNLPPYVLVIDGSTAGFKLLTLFEKYKSCRFIIIDALKADSCQKIGQVYRIPLEDFYNLSQPDYTGDEFISFHQTALSDVLNLFFLTGSARIRGYFIGINIFKSGDETLSFSMELTKEAEGSIDNIVHMVKDLI